MTVLLFAFRLTIGLASPCKLIDMENMVWDPDIRISEFTSNGSILVLDFITFSFHKVAALIAFYSS